VARRLLRVIASWGV